MKKILMLFIGFSMLMIFSVQVYAVTIVDVVEAPTGYFVPDDSQKKDSQYYRWYGDNWGWTHNPIADSFSTATLSISAFDVDWTASDPEVDIIQIYANGGWQNLGSLQGEDDTWSYTTFNLGASYFDEIATGLQVQIIIDSTNTGIWAVTLAKSVLNLDGGRVPDPEPGAKVPEPATLLLFGFSLLGLAGFKQRFK